MVDFEKFELPENDEPQFKVDNKVKVDAKSSIGSKQKSSSVKGVLVLLSAVLCVVAAIVFLDEIMGFGSKKPNVKNPSSIATVQGKQQEDTEQISSSPMNFVISPLGDNSTAAAIPPIGGQEEDQNAEGLNLVLATRLKELTLAMDTLSGQVELLKGQLMTVQRELGQQTMGVQRTLDNVKSTLEIAQRGDEHRDQLISRVLTDVRGFQKNLGDERERFTFKILHEEFYGGRVRLVGYDERRPQSILKVYVGDEVGLWRLIRIQNREAVFQHADGKEHRESFV